MKRFSFKKLILILFSLLLLIMAYAFLSRSSGTVQSVQNPAESSAPAQPDASGSAPAQPGETENSSPVQSSAEPTPEPTEMPELVVTDEFQIELEETEELGGF